FDTTPDLCGNDIDISRYVRDGDDTDVSLFWRDYADDQPPVTTDAPAAPELCRVSLHSARGFATALEKRRSQLARSAKPAERARSARLKLWRWDSLDREWSATTSPRPGDVLLAHPAAGGYDPALGWTGEL